ncbi:putative transcription factor interactor and regulator CCHC(Zn) family [Helianthus annuus]|uniref:uncharacterized protein LOC110866513 n=1 Tax=Helianthus annuus TaxID=4232 RepID=UPI000B8F08D6|nr:uncharacterized protein LOC110866513 [Helianthus annuus]KAJ0907054.1 putative transcription factor interactor and regulator CCHC(Zn) family [Helianthus annuus]
MPPRRNVNNHRNENNDIPIETLIANAVNTAIAGLVPNLLQQLQQNNNGPPGGNNNNGPPGGNNNNGPQGRNANPPVAIHDWLDRFQKLKPKSFSTAATPVEAENWIAHIEKNFEVLGVNDEFKVRLASYKLEDDAHRWWKTLKNARGGDNYAATLPWNEFRTLFYQQYFTDADRSEYLREYSSIMQGDDEPIMEFKTRFCRLVNFLGPTAGTVEQQTNTFKWAICDRDRKFILNLRFADINEIVDAVKNLDNDKKHRQRTLDDNRKRPREDNQSNSSFQGDNDQSRDRRHRSDRNYDNQMHQDKQNLPQYRDPPCATCKPHSGVCRRAERLCFNCGDAGHLVKECPKFNPRANSRGNARLATNDAASTPGIIFGQLHIN